MLLKGRGPNGPFTHRISRKKFDRLMAWLSHPDADTCLLRNGEHICKFFGQRRDPINPFAASCAGCLLDKLYGVLGLNYSCRCEEVTDIEMAWDVLIPPGRILRNARRRLRAMAKRGEEADNA